MAVASQRQLQALQMLASAESKGISSYTCTSSSHSSSLANGSHTGVASTDPARQQPGSKFFKHLQVSTTFQPSRQWLSIVWLEAMRPNIDWANRYMSTVKGRFWNMDHTFATARCIRDAKQQSVYKAVLTVVNEYSQLVAQWFTHTTSLFEVKKGLQLLRDRYKDENVKVRKSANFLRRQYNACHLEYKSVAISVIDMPLQGPEFIWVDNSDQSGQVLQGFFQ